MRLDLLRYACGTDGLCLLPTRRETSLMSAGSRKSELTLPKLLADRLRTIAKKRRVPMAKLISDMLNEYAKARGIRGATHEEGPKANPTDTAW